MGGFRHLGDGFRQGLAFFPRQQCRQFLRAPGDRVGRPVENVEALLGGRFLPIAQCLAGSRHRVVNVGSGGHCEATDNLGGVGGVAALAEVLG